MQGFVTTILPAHIVAGGLAIVFGYIALWAAKGGRLHRKTGLFFVGAMVVMSLSGAAIATFSPKSQSVSVVAGLLTFYLVASSLLTVRRTAQPNWMATASIVCALALCALGFRAGYMLAGTGRPEAIPAFIFGGVSLLAAFGDWRVFRAGTVQGTRRIRRHLWRMCFAMWVAAASFFWGPPGRVPEAINYPPLLAVAVLTPIAAMAYWSWRLRGTRTLASQTVERTVDAGAFTASPAVSQRG